MIETVAPMHCALGIDIGNTLLQGLVGSLGFFVNMLVLSGVFYIIRQYKLKHPKSHDLV